MANWWDWSGEAADREEARRQSVAAQLLAQAEAKYDRQVQQVRDDNAAFMRAAEQSDVVRFTGPDGVLVVYEAGQPTARTVHIARVNLDGTIAWTADTRLGRLRQVLPHGQLPALVGDFENQLTEPALVVVRLSDGTVSRQSLKGPMN